MLIKKIKNNTGSDKRYNGQTIVPGAYYQIQDVEELTWKDDTTLQTDISAGIAIVNDGTSDLSISEGLTHLQCVSSDCIVEVHVDASAIGDNKVLTYKSSSGKIEYQSVTASQVGLGNVKKTSDANKPVSTAQQTALDLKANLASPTFTGTVSGITKSMVGLGSVDNTADSAKTIAGDVTGTLAAATVANDAVTNAKLANVETQTFKGRTTASTGDPEDLTIAQAKTLLNLTGTNSGDQTITLTGGVTGSGTGSFAATVITNANLTGPVTSTGNATAIANGAISNAMLANSAVTNLSGTNTGDNAVNSLYSGLVSNATHTGDATGSTALSVVKIRGYSISATAPTNSQVLSYNTGTTQWEPTTLASGSASGAKGEIQVRGNTAGSFTAFANFNWDETKQSLQVGSAIASLGDALVTCAKSVNSYTQNVTQNSNAGANATTDLIVMNNLGTDTAYYFDIGMNSSAYSDNAYPLSIANDCYIYAENANVTLGTDSAGKYLLIHTGGMAVAQERARFVDATAAKDAYCKLSTHLQLLNDTTANRPTTPLAGMLRYNTSNSKFEGYENGAWTNLISSNSGTVTSVAMSVPAFLSISGSPITTSGTLAVTLSGTALPIANGGTGQTTANTALNALIPSQTANSGKYLTTNGTNTSWAASTRYLSSTLSDGTNPYISTVSTSYVILSKFIYSGSSDIGAITSIKAIVNQNAAGQTTSIRIYDVTNALVIAELTGFTDSSATIKDLGTISNLPTGAAIFEIQAKTSSATKTVYVSNVQCKIG